ncbi:MAG: vitamin B12-dependent ribonucleotide reductase, partial [Planctomycetes bacterium]|nr:vitamin B12-dependent ribonucleotide reductase [Planctomycetota bacterium]
HKFSVAGHEGYLTVGLYEDGQPGELFVTMAKEGSTVGGLMDVIGTCTSMALQYGVPLITLVDKFRHARFEPAGMTSNREIPFAKSVIDYIFCWLGCQFIPGYADKNLPNRVPSPSAKKESKKNNATAKELVEKTKDLTQKIAEVKSIKSTAPRASVSAPRTVAIADRAVAMVASAVSEDGDKSVQVIQEFNAQFQHFQDDAPACDVCGSITVRNGTCYKCFNCGNSMGCP